MAQPPNNPQTYSRSVYFKGSIFDNDEDYYEDEDTGSINWPVLNLPPYRIPPLYPTPTDYPKTSNDDIPENLCWRPPKSGNVVDNPSDPCDSSNASITRPALEPKPKLNALGIPIPKSRPLFLEKPDVIARVLAKNEEMDAQRKRLEKSLSTQYSQAFEYPDRYSSVFVNRPPSGLKPKPKPSNPNVMVRRDNVTECDPSNDPMIPIPRQLKKSNAPTPQVEDFKAVMKRIREMVLIEDHNDDDNDDYPDRYSPHA